MQMYTPNILVGLSPEAGISARSLSHSTKLLSRVELKVEF